MRRLSVMFYRVQGSLAIQATRKSETYNSSGMPTRKKQRQTANCLNTEMPAILMRRVIDGREQSQCSSCRAINHSDMNLRVHSPKLTEKGNRWDPFCIKDVESDTNNQLVKTAIK